MLEGYLHSIHLREGLMVLMELRVLDHDVVGVMIHSFHLRVLMEYLDYCDVRVESSHGHEMEDYYCVSLQ